MVKRLAQGPARIRTHILTPPELESDARDHLATTLQIPIDDVPSLFRSANLNVLVLATDVAILVNICIKFGILVANVFLPRNRG